MSKYSAPSLNEAKIDGAGDVQIKNSSRRDFLKKGVAGISAIVAAGCRNNGQFGYSNPAFKDLGTIPVDTRVTSQAGLLTSLDAVIAEATKNAAMKSENGSLLATPRTRNGRDAYVISFGYSACNDTCTIIGPKLADLDQNSDLPIVMLGVWPGFNGPSDSLAFARDNYRKAARAGQPRTYDPAHASWQLVDSPPFSPPKENDTPQDIATRNAIKDRYVWAIENAMTKLSIQENNVTRSNPDAYPEKGYTLLPDQQPGKGFHFSEKDHRHGQHVNVMLLVDRDTNRILKPYDALTTSPEALTEQIRRDAAKHRSGLELSRGLGKSGAALG